MQVVAHNLLAQFAGTQINKVNQSQNKTTERLSSGYKINRSADDAAGLAISEKLRWQIRGLNKGKQNIQDGMSLIDTADGALQETHSILQRVRELTIQAYNDTNTEQDRDAIQVEIDNCLKEVDRIADDTTFNTKQILKGNPMSLVKVTGDESIDVTTTMTMTKDLPTWLQGKVDIDFKVHDEYTQKQDTSGVMLEYDGINDSSKHYYGPLDASVPDGYTHISGWSDNIKNNASSKLDFGELANTTSGDKLYSRLFDLIGCKISYPCGTCSTQVNSITYGGSEKLLTTEAFESTAEVDVSGNLNLSAVQFTYNGKTYTGYFNAIQEVLDKYADNYDDDTTNDDKTAEQNEVSALAKSIAKDLRDKSASVLSKSMASHFDRVVNGDDDYSLIVYDYRDNIALNNKKAADTTVKTSCNVRYKVSLNMLKPGETALVESPLKVMCGALNSSYIDLNLQDLSLDSLGLSSYAINRYTTGERYSDSYQQKLMAWENNATEVKETKSYTAKVLDEIIPAVYSYKYVNGERSLVTVTPASLKYKEEQRTYDVTRKVYGPKPVAGAGDIIRTTVYDPDSVELVDNAIAKVSDARSSLGAIKNRLEYAYNNNANTEENSQAAESRLRDADMAADMVEFSKNNILQQAGIAMLSQANRNSDNVLQLLQ